MWSIIWVAFVISIIRLFNVFLLIELEGKGFIVWVLKQILKWAFVFLLVLVLYPWLFNRVFDYLSLDWVFTVEMGVAFYVVRYAFIPISLIEIRRSKKKRKEKEDFSKGFNEFFRPRN